MKKINKIEKEKKQINKKKLMIIILSSLSGLLLLIGLGIGIYYWSTDSLGTIKIDLGDYSSEYELKYTLTDSRAKATSTKKEVTKKANELLKHYDELFDSVNLYDDMKNIAYINAHINEEIEIDNDLYKSLKLVIDEKSREIFFGPLFEFNERVFSCENDIDAKKLDYNSDESVRTYYSSVYKFKNDENAINISFLDNNVIKLNVNEVYVDYLKEKEAKRYIDLAYLKTCFIVDYVSDKLIEEGYNNGYLMASDGTLRVFKNSIMKDYDVYDYNKGDIIVSNISLSGKNVVSVNKYRNKCYIFEDGRVINNYINPKGLGSDLTERSIVCYSSSKCSVIMLKIEGLMYTAISNYSTLASSGIYTLYIEDNNVKHNDSNLVFNMLLSNDKYEYKEVKL